MEGREKQRSGDSHLSGPGEDALACQPLRNAGDTSRTPADSPARSVCKTEPRLLGARLSSRELMC